MNCKFPVKEYFENRVLCRFGCFYLFVTASDESIVAMLGASPGTSTAVWIMLIFNTPAVF
jgi:malate:quinone oxidoreductase Mqo